MGGAVQSFSSPMLAEGMQSGLSGFGTSGIGMFAKGGKIIDQYDGRTPEDIWNNLSKSQRQHFIYDHLEEISVYKNIKELPSSEVIKAYNSDWRGLDKDIKNRFANHTREGQYAKGGKLQIVSRDKGSWGYLRFEGAIGSFGWIYDKKYNEGIIYPLDEFDRNITRDEKLKKGEFIFRYETDRMFGRMRPLIKFNLEKSLVYFGVNSEEGEVKFETRGIKLDYILLEEKYEEIYAEGGEVEDENQYDFSIRIYKDNLDILNDNPDYEDFRGTKEEVLKKVNDSLKKGEIVYAYIQIENIVTDWYHESGDLERMRMELNRYGEHEYAKGGEIQELQVGDIVTHKKGRQYGHGRIYKMSSIGIYLEDKYGNKREQPFYFPSEFKKVSKMFGEGGKADVYIENKNVKFDKKHYKGILSDFDLDGLPNVDDPDPFGNQDKSSIEQVKFSNTFNKVLQTKKTLDADLKKFVSKLQKSTSANEKIYARAKTPFSILNKLVDSRISKITLKLRNHRTVCGRKKKHL